MKKQQEPILTSPIEEPRHPLADDDAEPVKRLTAMGFSRTQVVDALERNGYDVQEAINYLLKNLLGS